MMPIARAWSVLWNSWKKGQGAAAGAAHGQGQHQTFIWSGQLVRLATAPAKLWPGNPGPSPARISSATTTTTDRIRAQPAGCARCARCNIHDVAASSGVSDRGDRGKIRQEDLLWNARFQDRAHGSRGSRHLTPTGGAPWPAPAPAWWMAPSPWTCLPDQADQLTGPTGPENMATPSSVRKLCQQGQVKAAVELLEVLAGTKSAGADKYLVYSLLKECVARQDLPLGDKLRALAVKMGLRSDTFLCSHFIRMYAGHGKLQEAMDVFSAVPLPDAFVWSSILSAHVKQGQAQRAVELYHRMRATSVKPDGHVLVSALQACAAAQDLDSGKQVHDDVVASGAHRHNMFVCNCLLDMFAKCGSLKDARRVFDALGGNKNVVTWSTMIAGYARVEGMGHEALALYGAMQQEGLTTPNAVTFVCLLQACANVGVSALDTGKQLHSQLKHQGLEESQVGGSLVNMYVKCGSLEDARLVFDTLGGGAGGDRDVIAWNAMISGYAQQEGMGHEALALYAAMRKQGLVAPSAVTYVCLLQACTNMGVAALDTGKHIHAQLEDRGLQLDVVVGASLVNMYVKCGSLGDARRVFDGLGEKAKDVVTWTAMITGYAQQEGMGQEALNLYSALRNQGMVAPDAVTYVCLLQACANVGVSALEAGRQLHSELIDHRLEEFDVVVGGSLVNMYAKCGSLMDARSVFDGLGSKNVVTWNAMISGYAQHEGMEQQALDLYSAMLNEGKTTPNAVTFACLLQACADAGVSALGKGKQLHLQLNDQGLEESDVAGSLVNMYVKCGSLEDARLVFDRLGAGDKDVSTWNAMMSGYAQQEGMDQQALDLYSIMHSEGRVAPNAVTFVCLLQACANVGESAIEIGKQLHAQLTEHRLEESDMVVVGSSLVNMYSKCGSPKDARIVFDGLGEKTKNVVTWTTMIAGYAQQEGRGQEALNLYSAMHSEGMAAPDAVTYVCLLQACANVGVSALQNGKQLHSELKHQRLEESDVVVGGSLVNMYAKCGSLKDARIVFDGLGQKNVVTWNAMISGYAQQEGMGQEALNIYRAMRDQGITAPSAVTYVCLLQACASVVALQQGKQLHSEIREAGLESNALVGTHLVRMYATCGALKDARQVFDRLPMKDLGTWTALLKGYAEHGEGSMAIQCFEMLLEQGIQPDEVTYICLFTACSHAGLVDEAQHYFETMVERHGVEPNDWHYNCMVDLLGRSGHLDRAEHILRTSGLSGDAVSWRALLSACKSFGDADTGKRCFDHLVKLDPTLSTAYALLGGIFADAGRWDEVGRVEGLRKAAGARKMPAKACIEVMKEVHEFTVGEERSDVAATLRKMNASVKQGGHVPQTQLVLRPVSEQEKEDALCGHAEKLALAYGLLHTPAGSPLVVTKNLRMCNDCHSSTKIMSRLEKREIVVRDGHKVHRFQNGACSCHDRP